MVEECIEICMELWAKNIKVLSLSLLHARAHHSRHIAIAL
jgi:hypothetical protein